MQPIIIDPAVRPIISTGLSKTQKQAKSKFSKEDDLKLISLVMSRNDRDWVWIAQQMTNRNPRQCRERWYNYLDPSLHKGGWTPEEDRLLMEKKKEMGPHWNAIARFFSGRSGNSVRNRWLLIMRHEEKSNNDLSQEPIEIRIPPIVPPDLEEQIIKKKTLSFDTDSCCVRLSNHLDKVLIPKSDINLFIIAEEEMDFLMNFD